MESIYLGIVIFLFLLAIFDLTVGVSNDAVNFLNSAIGAKAASFKTIILIAAVGIFCGATMSNGMMEIARHGIFRPEAFHFNELMCIFLAVMVTDVVLLDIFNTLGMPTSTTVSMVFELLGGTFALAIAENCCRSRVSDFCRIAEYRESIDRYFRYFPIGGYRFLFRNAGAILVADYLYL